MNEATTIENQIENFDPNDPEALAALEGQLSSDDIDPGESTDDMEDLEADEQAETQDFDETGKDDEEKAEDDDSKQDDKADEAEGEPSATQEEDPVVLTKSGKHTIPYSELVSARERAARAETTAKELQQRLEDLKAGKQVDNPGTDETQISDEELAEVEDVSPEIAKVLRQQRAMIEAMNKEIDSFKGDRETAQKNREQEILDEMTAAIAANEQLSAWKAAADREESPDATLWNRAADVDKLLRSDPEWQGKDFSERFERVVEVVNSMSGTRAKAADKSTTEKPTADLKKIADDKLKAGDHIPTSLSDIPGNAAIAQSDAENLENISVTALGNKFQNMTTDQIESYLARIG